MLTSSLAGCARRVSTVNVVGLFADSMGLSPVTNTLPASDSPSISPDDVTSAINLRPTDIQLSESWLRVSEGSGFRSPRSDGWRFGLA